MSNFIFYDTETTGTDIWFDQVLKFAAVLTDENLTVLDVMSVSCRCQPWIIPSPVAMSVTGLTPSDLYSKKLPTHYQMMCQIAETLKRWGPAVYLGYNTISFDEPMMQHALWLALQEPYLSLLDGSSRMDVLPLAQAVSHFHPDTLQIPQRDGKPTFRLDQLAPANGFNHDNAHDALPDVYATIHIAKILKSADQNLWNHAVAMSPKKNTAALIQGDRPNLYIQYYGKPEHWWGMPLMRQSGAPSDIPVVKLNTDFAAVLTNDDDDTLDALLATAPYPITTLKTNKAPLVITQTQAQNWYGISPSKEDIQQMSYLTSNDAARKRLIEAYKRNKPAYPERETLEERIYDGFPTNADKRLMDSFHKANWQQRIELTPQFSDMRYSQIAQRILYAENPEFLSEAVRSKLRHAISDRFYDTADTKRPRSIPDAYNEIEDAVARSAEPDMKNTLNHWLDSLQARVPKQTETGRPPQQSQSDADQYSLFLTE